MFISVKHFFLCREIFTNDSWESRSFYEVLPLEATRNRVSSPDWKLIIASMVAYIWNANTEAIRQKMTWNSITILLVHLKNPSQWEIFSSKSRVGQYLKTISKIILIVYMCTHVYKHQNRHFFTNTHVQKYTDMCTHTKHL